MRQGDGSYGIYFSSWLLFQQPSATYGEVDIAFDTTDPVLLPSLVDLSVPPSFELATL
jgi:hypothetical protein